MKMAENTLSIPHSSRMLSMKTELASEMMMASASGAALTACRAASASGCTFSLHTAGIELHLPSATAHFFMWFTMSSREAPSLCSWSRSLLTKSRQSSYQLLISFFTTSRAPPPKVPPTHVSAFPSTRVLSKSNTNNFRFFSSAMASRVPRSDPESDKVPALL